MQRMLFVNLPVADLPRAMAFWRALGFDFNPDYTDETAACLVLSEQNFAMLLTHAKWAEFSAEPPADTARTREVMIALQLESRAEVDRVAALAAASGGSLDGEPKDHGFMYYRALRDPDGHRWEMMFFPPQGQAA